MKKTIYTITMLLVLVGCASLSNVSTHPEFAEFIGNEITLKKQLLVCKEKPLKTESGSYIEKRLIYNINQMTRCPFGETIGLLPAGTILYISKVEKHKLTNIKSATHIYFIGRSNMPNGSEFTFYYLYGHEGFYEHQPW